MNRPQHVPAVLLAAALSLALAMPAAAAERDGLPARGAASTDWAPNWEWAGVTDNGWRLPDARRKAPPMNADGRGSSGLRWQAKRDTALG
jgi:hypothetical protein